MECLQGLPWAAGQSHSWEIGSLESPQPQRTPLPALTLLLSLEWIIGADT